MPAAPSRETRTLVNKMVTYISDDRYIANHCGVRTAFVRVARARLPMGHYLPGASRSENVASTPIAHSARDYSRSDAAEGCRKLLKAYHRYYQKHVRGRAA